MSDSCSPVRERCSEIRRRGSVISTSVIRWIVFFSRLTVTEATTICLLWLNGSTRYPLLESINSSVRRRSLFTTINGENIPEAVGIQAVNRKTYRQVNDELRAAQQQAVQHIGSTMGIAWVHFIPAFLLPIFIRLASRNIEMQKRFGVVAVTAVGMFSSGPMWLVPLTNATITVAVGSIAQRPKLIDGGLQEREDLCLTVSFDHDIVDGAPAARFTSRFAELLSSGDELCEI